MLGTSNLEQGLSCDPHTLHPKPLMGGAAQRHSWFITAIERLNIGSLGQLSTGSPRLLPDVLASSSYFHLLYKELRISLFLFFSDKRPAK